MDSHQDFTLFSKSTSTSLWGYPLFPSQPSAAPQQQTPSSSFNTIYCRIFNLLNTNIVSARSFSHTTTSKYQEWCCGATTHLLSFAAANSRAATALEIALMKYYHGNFAAAVEAAEMELREKRELLAWFLRWAGQRQGVSENCLWEFWWWVQGPQEREVSLRDQGQRGQEEESDWAEISQEIERQRSERQQEEEQEWGPWAQNAGVASGVTSSAASSTSSASSASSASSDSSALSPTSIPLDYTALLADLHRPNRDTITPQEASATWHKLPSWLNTTIGDNVTEAPEIFDHPPEIYEVPLYDSPISEEVIEMQYSGVYRDGMDYDVWKERQDELK